MDATLSKLQKESCRSTAATLALIEAEADGIDHRDRSPFRALDGGAAKHVKQHVEQEAMAKDVAGQDAYIGDPVIFRDFDDCTIAQVYADGSIDVEIPGFGKQIVPEGLWQIKRKGAVPSVGSNGYGYGNAMQESSGEEIDLAEQQRRKARDEAEMEMEAILAQHVMPVEESPLQNAWLSKKNNKGKRNHEVFLNVYDLDRITAKLNDLALRKAGIGAFHVGVEILGDEWFFAWGEPDSTATGVLYSEPRGHQVHVYRESHSMGISPLTEDQVKKAVLKAMEIWPGNSYHIVHRNCIHFAEDFVKKLGCAEPFPQWLKGAQETAGQNPMLSPIAEWGMGIMKWCHGVPQQVVVEDGSGEQDASANCFCARPKKNLAAG